MPDPIIWPRKLLPPASIQVALESQSRGGGQSISGQEQVVVSPAARWAIRFAEVPVGTRDKILAWRAIEAQAMGRANPLLVPIYDWRRSPGGYPVTVTHSDDAPLSDDSEYESPVSHITLAANAALNAVALSIIWDGFKPEAGQHFSIGQRLHRITSLQETTTTTGTISIRPWLRAAATSGAALEFDNPVCLVRLAKDDGMNLDLSLGRIGRPTVEFVEYF